MSSCRADLHKHYYWLHIKFHVGFTFLWKFDACCLPPITSKTSMKAPFILNCSINRWIHDELRISMLFQKKSRNLFYQIMQIIGRRLNIQLTAWEKSWIMYGYHFIISSPQSKTVMWSAWVVEKIRKRQQCFMFDIVYWMNKHVTWWVINCRRGKKTQDWTLGRTAHENAIYRADNVKMKICNECLIIITMRSCLKAHLESNNLQCLRRMNGIS